MDANVSINPQKPPEGSWTEHYGLGTSDVSLGDSTTKENFDLEMEAIFRRCWLNVARAEELPRVGSYITKELPWLNASILIVRGADDKIRAFWNMCAHRGNQLVWDEKPSVEVKGNCRVFQCKYHGWRYNLDGTLAAIARPGEFFNVDMDTHGLRSVSCDIWEGWVFINLDDDPEVALKDFMGEAGAGLEGYPFHKMTDVWTFKSQIKSNWKPSVDGVMEVLHAPFLHNHLQPEFAGADTGEATVTADAVMFKILDWHRMASWLHVPLEVDDGTPAEKMFGSRLFGPVKKPELGTELPTGLNPTRHPEWGIDSYTFFPNWTLLVWEGNFYMTFRYWPVSVGEHIFECKLYHMPAKNAEERLAQEMQVITNKEFAMQDFNTYEATQRMVNTGVMKEFPISDQEVLIRHFHKMLDRQVADFQSEKM